MLKVKLNLLDNTIKIYKDKNIVYQCTKFKQPTDYWYDFQIDNVYYGCQIMYDFEENIIFIGLWNISKNANNTLVENQEKFEFEIIM